MLRSRVIVGEKDNETPIFDDRIRYIEINPSWYVPTSIVPELAEKEARRPGYLARSGFVWRGIDGSQTLVQKPGPENALGRIKFLFPNHHSVYLHDTPQRGLFARSQRSLSHGCVRVEKPDELALALLGDQGWDEPRLQTAYGSTKTRRIELREPVPVFLDYRTAFVDERGAAESARRSLRLRSRRHHAVRGQGASARTLPRRGHHIAVGHHFARRLDPARRSVAPGVLTRDNERRLIPAPRSCSRD